MILYSPAKTFLIGEYVATIGGPSIVLATQPSFSLRTDETARGLVNIHSESPAGLWYAQQVQKPSGLLFSDPYQSKGGLGASSAQFVLVYQAVKKFQQQAYDDKSLLADYYHVAWSGKGIRPSGYDVLTQHAGHSLFIDSQGTKQKSLDWTFTEVNALLIHTGNKLATHLHLAEKQQPNVEALQPVVYRALNAWEQSDESAMVDAISTYHRELSKQQLVAPNTAYLVEQLQGLPGVLAAKGCGAMGADVLLVLVKKHHSNSIQAAIKKKGLFLLAEIAILS